MSNLTVSYVSQTPAGPPAGASAAAPAPDGPLGFLAALVEQLLGAGTEAADAGTTADGGANVDIAGLLNVALGTATGTTPGATQAPDPLAALATQLDKLQAQFATGEPPPPDQLQTLRDAIDALTAAIDGTPQTSAVPQVAPDTQIAALRDQLLALGQNVAATAPDLSQKLQALATKLEANPQVAIQLGLAAPQPDSDAATIAQIIRTLLGHGSSADKTDSSKSDPVAAPAANPAPQVEDDLLQLLATLGLNTPSTTAAAPTANVESAAAVTATAAVPQALVRLSTQLSQVASEFAATAPDLARKLEAVATRLVSADAGPDLLAKLTGAASQSDGTALDKLVQSLIEAKPVSAPAAAAPQIAAATLPAPIAPKQSKSAVTEVKAAPPEPAPVTADSAPKPAPGVTIAAATRDAAPDATPEPKVEAKAAAIVADATKTDATAQPAQAPTAPAVAPQARALPAAYQTVANPINMGQVAFEMVRQAHQGTSRFTIRLDPPEMGRVDVRMQVDANGTVNARLTVDRAETLDLFQRDRQSLERALAQAGLDASKTNLEFSLRQQNHNPFAGMMGGDQHQQSGYGGAPRYAASGTDDIAPLPAVTLYRGTASAGGVNIFA